MSFLWGLTLLSSVLGALNFLFTMAAATSAPQQAAGYAASCALAIVPYVFCRSLQLGADISAKTATKEIIAAIQKNDSTEKS